MRFNHLIRISSILTLIFCVQTCTKEIKAVNGSVFKNQNDSINFWIEESKKESYSIRKRKGFLDKTYQGIMALEIDSVLLRNLSTIAYLNLKTGDTLLFKKRNNEALLIAHRIKDSFAMGDIHWNYASYYNKIQIFDSAYYHFDKAHFYFTQKNHTYESAKTQYGMAFIKGRFKDYSGSEILTFKAIDKFREINHRKSLFSCYNHLGTLQNDILEYEKSLFYYNKALEYKENENQYCAIKNNIGNTYLKKGDYAEAIAHFNKVISIYAERSLNTNQYARVLSNRAYAMLKRGDTLNVWRDLGKALHIRDSLNNKGGIIISKIHIANFLSFKKDTIGAIKFAKEANHLAREVKNSRDYLESLILLAKLDAKNTSKYLKQHIRFSDSIQIINRRNQNKFTRIAYETDEYIRETKRLSKQKTWILLTSFVLISILSLLYLIKLERSKNEKLVFENEEQKINEQIYSITLKQQEKLEKEKIKERNRIAEELHDGILGKLFGARIGLGFLDIGTNEKVRDQHREFLGELQTVEKEIREVSHKLSENIESAQVSFPKIVDQLLINNSKIGKFDYTLSFEGNIEWPKIDEKIKVNLYRVIQEALQNIMKYASAKKVTIIFTNIGSENLEITIKDDGLGFNVNQKKKGIGLKNMKSRIEKLGGSLGIHSKLGSGSKIEILIPI